MLRAPHRAKRWGARSFVADANRRVGISLRVDADMDPLPVEWRGFHMVRGLTVGIGRVTIQGRRVWEWMRLGGWNSNPWDWLQALPVPESARDERNGSPRAEEEWE